MPEKRTCVMNVHTVYHISWATQRSLLLIFFQFFSVLPLGKGNYFQLREVLLDVSIQ